MATYEDFAHKHISAVERGFDIGSFLTRQFQRTPWWLSSAAAHGLLFLLLVALSTGVAAEPGKVIFKARVLEPERLPDLDLEKWEITNQNNPIERGEAEVYVEFDKMADHPETPDNEPYHEARGDDMEAFSLDEFEGKGNVNVIGPGVGGGGGFGDRRGGMEKIGSRGRASGRKQYDAIIAALLWLARHQMPDGRWDSDGFDARCQGAICEGKGGSTYDPGLTGLALLAFLGAGYTHLDTCVHEGVCFGKVVNAGLKYLKEIQSENGCFGDPTAPRMMYNHILGTLAVTEAYGLTGSFRFKDCAQEAINFLAKAQNPERGWRYTPLCGHNDTSVTSWAVMAMSDARISKLDVPPQVFENAIAWFNEVMEESYYKHGYTTVGDEPASVPNVNDDYKPYPTMTAAAIVGRVFAGQRLTQPLISGAVRMLLEDGNLPVWDAARKTTDYYYWYYGTLAVYLCDGPHPGKEEGGPLWKRWNSAMLGALLKNQIGKDGGCARGSWPADTSRGFGKWCVEGGRVYATAINALTLEACFRFRIPGTERN